MITLMDRYLLSIVPTCVGRENSSECMDGSKEYFQ